MQGEEMNTTWEQTRNRYTMHAFGKLACLKPDSLVATKMLMMRLLLPSPVEGLAEEDWTICVPNGFSSIN